MKRLAVLFVLAFSYASIASATTITFSEVGAGNSAFLSSDGQVFVEYVWSTGLNDGHSHPALAGGNPGAFEQGHGQAFQGLRVSNVGGGAITLDSFDMQGQWWVSSLNDGSGTQYSTAFGAWVTQMANFTSTPYVYIYSTGGGSGWLDNVVVSRGAAAVPEPSSLLLLGGGLLAGVRRYRRRRA